MTYTVDVITNSTMTSAYIPNKLILYSIYIQLRWTLITISRTVAIHLSSCKRTYPLAYAIAQVAYDSVPGRARPTAEC